MRHKTQDTRRKQELETCDLRLKTRDSVSEASDINGQRQTTADHTCLRGVQTAELRNHKEQGQHQGTPGVAQVLPLVPRAHVAQGKPLKAGFPYYVLLITSDRVLDT